MARFRRDAPRDRRTAGRREPRARILVVCCGATTEPAYLNGLRQLYRAANVTVKVKSTVGSPSQIVEYTRRVLAHHDDEYDEVWCVVDVDQFPDVPTAMTAANSSGIQLAVSNPCFELWLLLHFEDPPERCVGYPDAVRHLRHHLPDYQKRGLNFADFPPGVSAAIARGERLHPVRGTSPHRPRSGVWRLVHRIVNSAPPPTRPDQ